ncbi:MAG: putative nucleotidyltransferase substrate binding domain-containing protein [Thermodesulfobacteriota bacterium]
MTQPSKNAHHAQPEMVRNFLAGFLPFKDLPAEEIDRIAKRTTIDFFPKGTLIFRQDQTDVSHLHIIQRGGVRIYIVDEDGEETLRDYRGEGEYFGALPIIQGGSANLNVETVEDTFCFLLEKSVLVELISHYPPVATYFLRSMTDKLVRTAYSELRKHKVQPKTESALYLFTARVEEIAKGKLHTVAPGITVQEAARIMADHHIGSLLIRDAAGKIIGIVTDKDLRTGVVAKGLDYRTPVEKIMTFPVRSIPSHAICFDALLRMMSAKIHHLAVERQDEIVGMVTTHDIMLLQGTSPLYFFREIIAQQTIEGLYPISNKIPAVVRHLLEEGAKANNITRMITVLNDHILDRMLTLLIEKTGTPPLPFCWLLMGSEGRREQTFRTDQDNALIYRPTEDPELAREAEEYFREFTAKAIEHLVACGFPRCPGDIMASNPKWRQDAVAWRRYFRNWLLVPDPREVLHSTIFFDFRAGYGDTDLADELRTMLCKEAPKQEIYLYHLAKDCLTTRPPLSFFKNFIVEKDGEHKNTLDLKTRGLVPFVDFARLYALKYGIRETNTPARLLLLCEQGHMSCDLCAETNEAYEFLMQIRLVHQMRLIEEGRQPNNHLNPADLSDLEKQTLKEAFSVIRRLQSHIRQEFHLGDG